MSRPYKRATVESRSGQASRVRVMTTASRELHRPRFDRMNESGMLWATMSLQISARVKLRDISLCRRIKSRLTGSGVGGHRHCSRVLSPLSRVERGRRTAEDAWLRAGPRDRFGPADGTGQLEGCGVVGTGARPHRVVSGPCARPGERPRRHRGRRAPRARRRGPQSLEHLPAAYGPAGACGLAACARDKDHKRAHKHCELCSD